MLNAIAVILRSLPRPVTRFLSERGVLDNENSRQRENPRICFAPASGEQLHRSVGTAKAMPLAIEKVRGITGAATTAGAYSVTSFGSENPRAIKHAMKSKAARS